MFIHCTNKALNQYFFSAEPDTPVILDSGDIKEGESKIITCEAKNMFPAGNIHWFSESTEITDDATEAMTENPAKLFDVTSKLSYEPVRQYNGFEIRCEIRHQLLPGPSYPKDILKLNITCK